MIPSLECEKNIGDAVRPPNEELFKEALSVCFPLQELLLQPSPTPKNQHTVALPSGIDQTIIHRLVEQLNTLSFSLSDAFRRITCLQILNPQMQLPPEYEGFLQHFANADKFTTLSQEEQLQLEKVNQELNKRLIATINSLLFNN